MGYSYEEEIILQMVMNFLWQFLLVWLLGVAASVLLGVAAYNDSKALCSNSGVMWGLLIGFFCVIPGIIYLCLRKSHLKKPIVCGNCRGSYWNNIESCPGCGAPNPLNAMRMDPRLPEYAKRAKTTLIIGIILEALAIILSIVMVVLMMNSIFNLAAYGGYYY